MTMDYNTIAWKKLDTTGNDGGSDS
jgi:hypothetical protein